MHSANFLIWSEAISGAFNLFNFHTWLGGKKKDEIEKENCEASAHQRHQHILLETWKSLGGKKKL